jgi:outer membrane protein assembly factor BamA
VALLMAGVSLAQPAPPPMLARPESAETVEASAPEVIAVELHLAESVDTTGLADLVAVRKGQRLSQRAVRRSMDRLWATGRFTDVVVRAVDVPGGVRLVFQLTPAEVLARLTVEGNVTLGDEAILEASGLQESGPLEQDKVDAAVAAIVEAYRRKGYDEAKVTVTRELAFGGVGLVLTLDEGVPTRVGKVTLTGSPGLPLARMLEALNLRAGEVFDRSGLEAGLERLRAILREQRHYRARVGSPTIGVEGHTATVALPVSAGPRYTFHFHGNHRVPSAMLENLLSYDGAEPLDGTVAERLARRLASFYRYRGFHDVRVFPREVLSPDASEAVLAFDIEEGQALVMSEVRFRGNVALSTALLREMLVGHVIAGEPRPALELPLRDDPMRLEGHTGRKPRVSAPQPDPSTVFVEEAYQRAAEGMTEAYHERGFLSAKVRFRSLQVDVTGRTAVADFEVEEGPQAWVREVTFSGLPPGFTLPEEVLGREGQPLSLDAVEKGRNAIVRALSREGYLFASAEVEPRVEEGGQVARVHYQVEPGSRVLVGKVIIQGLGRTEEETVLANLDLREGQPLDMEKLADGQRRLARLNIFRQAEVQLADPNRPEATKDVVVMVQERARIDGQVSGGYFLQDGPRLTLDTNFPNVDGRGLNMIARGKINYVGLSLDGLSGRYAGDANLEGLNALGGRGNVAFSLPRLALLLPLEVGARLDLIGERVHRPAYISNRYAAVGGLDWAAARWLNVSLQYEIENNELTTRGFGVASTREDLERLRFPQGTFLLHSLRPSASLDFRDDPANPRKGLLVSTSAEFTNRLSPERLSEAEVPSPIDWVKLSGTVSMYAPLGRRASVAVSARAGTIVPLSAGARPIGSKLFFLGGSSSLRGFREDGVLPEDQRAALRQQLADCRSLIHPSGCNQELRSVLGGRAPLSQGGELFTLGKAELRMPAFTSLDLGVFLEAGNLWADRTNFDALRLRTTAGAGLRYVTPVGPLAFDVGFSLDRDVAINEPQAQFHFSIGAF